MRKYIITTIICLMGHMAFSQIVFPPTGQSSYTVGNGETVELSNELGIILRPNTHIQDGATFKMVIIAPQIPNDSFEEPLLGDENYLLVRNFQTGTASFDPNTLLEADVYENITYFDGLGRPIQQLAIKASPSQNDIITHMEYDSFGRMAEEWLPYHEPTGDVGSYRGDRATQTRAYYKTHYGDDFVGLTVDNVNAFSEKEFEESPLNRVFKQAAPGEDWKLGNGHEIGYEYETNGTEEVRRFGVSIAINQDSFTPTLEDNSNDYYAAGELYKTIVKDENNQGGADHSTEEFTDKEGRVVLKRTYDAGEAHDTYYVYDDYNNLTYVLPPKVDTTDGVSTQELDGLCYQYVYDHRNRLVEKKIPGKGWEYIVYNKLDQPIMTQDPNLRANDQWLFTKYDAFGRVVYTGRDDNTSATRIAAQNAANNASATYESRRSTSVNLAGTPMYYTNNAYLNSFNKVYTVNYYDSYVDTGGLSVPSTVLGQSMATNVKGLPTVNKVRVLGTDNWITTITGYDEKGRAIYTASKNDYLNTMDVVETELDFGGKVLRTRSTHTYGTEPSIVTEDRYTYDHAGRVLSQTQTINDQTAETLVENSYDNLGLLVKKEVGGGLQTVDYGYNVRGWLKTINDVNDMGNDLFTFDISYNQGDGLVDLFNGNISAAAWRTVNDVATDTPARVYKYRYDALNRLKSGFCDGSILGQADAVYAEVLAYDKSGNILSLERTGNNQYEPFDRLAYNYFANSNTLLWVKDNAEDPVKAEGFFDGNDYTIDYSYDANRNMTLDLNKGIINIDYNHLNLPVRVDVDNTIDIGVIVYRYDATGRKLGKTSTNGTFTEYCGNYIYDDRKLQFFNHPEGYVTPKDPDDLSQGFDYIYQYRDHLGNVRLSYTDSNNDGSIDASSEIIEESNYYPFGMKHRGYNDVISPNGNSVAQRWKYNGKEIDEDFGLNLYHYGFRLYDPIIGRFPSIDPISDQFPHVSTYNYAENNPTSKVDLHGLQAIDPSVIAFGQIRSQIQQVGGEEAVRSFDKQNLESSASTVDILPVIGDGKGLIEAFTGEDLITGEELSFGNRVLGIILLSELRVIDKVADAAKTLAKNVKIGKKGENLVTNALKTEFQGDEVLQQVTGKFSDGTTTRLDNIIVDAKTGNIKLIGETKTGNAKLTEQQKRFFINGESIELVGDNARSLKGQTIDNTTSTIRTTTVDRKLLED